MLKAKLLTNFVALLTFAGLFYQCTDDHHARFEDPPWLGGTNIETLEKEGKYNSFLALMDKADYRTSIENQLFTLFVPSDSSFNEYLSTIGKSSIDDLTVQEAEELFGLHILVNGRSRDQLMYEYAWNELESNEGEYGTLFHRKQTYSIPLDYEEENRYYEQIESPTVRLYRNNTFVPLWTTEYFDDYGATIGDGFDYTFMYPNSEWSGTQWHDAMVTKGEVRTSTGFIYYLDRVVKPIPTIDQYLSQNQDKFGVFYDLAQRYASYGSRKLDENDRPTYRKSYDNILNIAHEAGPTTGHPNNMLNMFTAFIPTDDVMNEYLNSTVLQYYDSVHHAPELYVTFLLQSHLSTFLLLPSKMDERFYNFYGDKIDIDINTDISDAFMCGNGAIYYMNRLLEPNAFTCVPGPIFYNSNYTTFLFALNQSGFLTTLSQPNINVTLLAATNDELLDYGIRTNTSGNNTYIEIRSSDDKWHSIESKHLDQFVQDHYCYNVIEDFNGEGFIRMASDSWIHYKDGKISAGGNQINNDNATVSEKIESDKNGNLFYVTKPMKKPKKVAEVVFSDPDLSRFKELLIAAELIDSTQIEYELPGIERPRINFIGGEGLEQWTILAPSNQAIADAELAGIVPSEKEALRDFLYYHFANNKCVFDDGVYSGSLPTKLKGAVVNGEVTFEFLEFSNSPKNLSVIDKSGQTVTIDHANANIIAERAVIHKINSVLVTE